MERDETMFTVKPLPSVEERDEALVIGLFEGANSWSGLAGEYDARLGGRLSELQKEGDISAKRGSHRHRSSIFADGGRSGCISSVSAKNES